MRKSVLVYIFMTGVIFTLFSCSEDIGIKEFKFQCETDNDCKEGYVCDKVKGCIKAVKDAGPDALADIMGDITDVSDISDIVDAEDILDVFDAQDAEIIQDADVLDIEDVTDIVIIEDVGISDAGDGGSDVQVNYMLRLDSVYDFSSGICTSPNYILESVSGFSASDEMKNSQFILHRSMLFKK